MRPLIAITCNVEHKTVAGNDRIIQTINDAYIRAVESAGGLSLVVPNGLSEEDIAELAEKVDGLILSGGGDIAPECFGSDAEEDCHGVEPLRDETELMLARYFLDHTDKPVFGICRGLQLLNVALGGDLIVDLPKAGKEIHSFTGRPRNEFTHEIIVEEDSLLKRLLGEENRVNSFHHQAIDKLGKGLKVNAYSKNDHVIEGVEIPGERFILAVQWHPEELIENRYHKNLFEYFMKQAIGSRTTLG